MAIEGYDGRQQTCVVEETRTIPVKLECLERDLFILQEAVDELERRLHPVLNFGAGEATTKTSSPCPPPPPGSELAVLLETYANRVSSVSRQVRELINDLEL